MNIPTLYSDGRVDRPPHLFVDAIEFTLDHWTHELRWGDWNFLKGASLLAAEVHASGLEWASIASRFRAAGIDNGVAAGEADRMLKLAWLWAPHRSARWIQFTRELILVRGTEEIYHLLSGGLIPRGDFQSLFSDALYDAEIGYVFSDYLIEVERVICDSSQPRGFHVVDTVLVFNSP